MIASMDVSDIAKKSKVPKTTNKSPASKISGQNRIQ